LRVDQLQDIVKVQGDVDAVCDAAEDVHFVDPALKVNDKLGAFDGKRRLVAERVEIRKLMQTVRLTGFPS